MPRGQSDISRRILGLLPRHLQLTRIDATRKDDQIDFLVQQAIERLRPELVARLPCTLECDPQFAVRAGGRKYLLHLLLGEVASKEDQRQRLAQDAPLLDSFAKARGVTVERAGVGMVRDGDGYEVLLAGFDELREKYSRTD